MSRARPGRSRSSTPSVWPPATSRRCCRSTTSTSTTRPSRRPRQLVDALRRGERPLPTRGAPLTDLKTVELELAGIFPDLAGAVAGNSAAPETLRGAQLAADRGWVAPAMPDTPPALPDLPEKSR